MINKIMLTLVGCEQFYGLTSLEKGPYYREWGLESMAKRAVLVGLSLFAYMEISCIV
jgi:hypothetical protein